jgi:uncharacterized protein (DUF983 family)
MGGDIRNSRDRWVFNVYKGEKMKKCEVCGEPILGNEIRSLTVYLKHDYICPKCKTEYEFDDSVVLWLILTILSILILFISFNLLTFEMVRMGTAIMFSITVFYHLFTHAKAQGFLVKIIRKNNESGEIK